MEMELFDARAAGPSRYVLLEPPIHKEIKRLYDLSCHRWRQYKDVPRAYFKRHEFYTTCRANSTEKCPINDETFIAWRQDQDEDENILFCSGKSGIGKSFITSRVIDSLRQDGSHCVYFYLGSGKVQSASGVILALLEQIYELTGTWPPSLEWDTEILEQEFFEEDLVSESSEERASGGLELPQEDSDTSVTNQDNYNSITHPESHVSIENSRDGTNSFKQVLGIIVYPSLRGTLHSCPPLETLLDALREACSSQVFSSSVLFAVFDAWDEDNMDVAEEFQQIIEVLSSCPCKIYVSGRPNHYFKADLEVFINERQEGVGDHIREQFQTGLRSVPNDIIKKAVQEILWASDRGFNVANIMTQTLLKAPDQEYHIQKLLDKRFSGISRDVGFQLLNPQNELVEISTIEKAIIIWLLDAERPLCFNALKLLLPTIVKYQEPGQSDLNVEGLSDMLRSYQPFVTIDPGNNVVGLNVAINNHSDIARIWPGDMPKVYSAIIKASVELIEQESPTGLYRVESEIADLFRRRPDLEHAATWPTYVRRLARIGGNAFDDVKGVINKLFDNQEHYLFALQLYFYTKEDPCRPPMSWSAFCRLQIAARWGFIWLVQQILEEMPEEISKCDSKASTALHEASKRGFTEIIKILLEKTPPVDCFDAEGKTPLEYALENGHSETFIRLFNAQVTTSAKSISNEMVSKYCRIRHRHYDVDDRRFRELTVLQIISKDDEQQTNVLSFLLATGTDPNCVDEHGQPALYLAVKHKKAKMVHALLRGNADHSKETMYAQGSPLHLAARLGLLDIIDMLLEAGSDMESTDWLGKTPIFYALEGYREEEHKINATFRKLISMGADYNHSDRSQQRPIHVAAMKGLVEPLSLLKSLVKDIAPKDVEGRTPLDYARQEGHKNVELLLQD
ncbi:ankyrin repeat-containing domain protein [Xylaria flabelliformis]|nr:ankyrin repeat-containing domain protein [Xylaria flabelliformis]